MTPEHYIMNEIRLWCGEHDLLCFRCNVGRVLTAQGTYFDTGLPNGFPDLMILGHNGKIVFCECKAPGGKLRQDQVTLHALLHARGFDVVVAYSVRDLELYMNNI